MGVAALGRALAKRAGVERSRSSGTCWPASRRSKGWAPSCTSQQTRRGRRPGPSMRAERRATTLGPLAGVPIAHKDIFVTADMPSTAGSKMLAGYASPFDATVVARLAAAGTVSLGKLNCDEFAMGSANENSAFGPVRNPWDRFARARRLVRRLGSRCRRALAARRHRHRYRRFDPTTGQLLRHHRHQADLWCVLALGHGRLCVEPRPGRAAGALGRRLCTAAVGHERLRRPRLDQRRACAAGLPRADAGDESGRDGVAPVGRVAHRPAARVLPGRAGQRRERRPARGAGRVRAPRRDPGRRQPAAHRVVDPRLLHHRAGRGQLEPVALRRREVRPPRREVRRPGRHVRQDPRRRFRRRGQAPHHDRHLRAERTATTTPTTCRRKNCGA